MTLHQWEKIIKTYLILKLKAMVKDFNYGINFRKI